MSNLYIMKRRTPTELEAMAMALIRDRPIPEITQRFRCSLPELLTAAKLQLQANDRRKMARGLVALDADQ